ncbi:MAG: hypothetical protein N4A46_11165 [Schleiferiaceae bacterium]|nr:hypothetical protein [Schleiferiaceae bacterium]
MKNVITLLLALAITYSFGQNEYFADDHLGNDFAFVGDKLFIAYDEHLSLLSEKSSFKSPNIQFQGSELVGFLTDYNNLYLVEQNAPYRMLLVDVNNSSQPQVVIDERILTQPSAMVKVKNQIFISEFGGDKISVIDITKPKPWVPRVIIQNLDGPNDMCLVDDEIYVNLSQENKIVKFNINDPAYTVQDVITDGLNWPYGLELIGNDMYVSNTRGNRIVKFNIKEISPQLTEVCQVHTPLDLHYHKGDLYIMSRDEDMLVTEPIKWSGQPNEISMDLVLYPNPAANNIHLKNNFDILKGDIYSLNGSIVKSARFNGTSPVYVGDLEPGLFSLVLENEEVFKFVVK